ncbi:MAG: GGDEF and EAL domain-containing protein [Spirochaetes bacterium]|nr:GGDEF and EAL domain-containing protein [Spirochaetota bacterium]
MPFGPIGIPEFLVPAICAGGLLFGMLLFIFLWMRGREPLNRNIIVIGGVGLVFVGSEMMVLALGGWHRDAELGRQFHRLEQIAGAWFLLALPLLVEQVLPLPRAVFRFNRGLIWAGFAVALAVTAIAFIRPDLYISQTRASATALLHPGDFGRGLEGPLYRLRDVSVGVLMAYTAALIAIYLRRQAQIEYFLPMLVSLCLAFYASIDDIVFVYFRFYIDPLGAWPFSRFSLGITLVVFSSMVTTLLRFLHQRPELRSANQALDKLLVSAEEKLYRDPLTGLPNRVSLVRDLESPGEVHLILGNLNRFGDINDFYGMRVGDILLRSMTRRVDEFCRARGLHLYKFRGDEFAFLVPGDRSTQALERLALDIHRHVTQRPYRYDEHRIELKLALGIGVGKESILEKADSALRQAKKDRRPYAVSDSVHETDHDFTVNLRRAKQIRDAIREERVHVWYQPIHDNREGRIGKHEALVRLLDTDGAILAPGEFLATARRTNLYGPVSRVVVRRVLAKLGETRQELSMNLSAEDLQDEETLALIFRGLERDGAERLVFEIVETEGMGDYTAVHEFIRRVRERGCRVAIDDFGTGYSTFQHLLRLKVDFIKIDGSLIKNIDRDDNSRILVANIVDFSRKLGILTVAEYVHSREVQDIVLSLGVHYSQGYLFGAPAVELR